MIEMPTAEFVIQGSLLQLMGKKIKALLRTGPNFIESWNKLHGSAVRFPAQISFNAK